MKTYKFVSIKPLDTAPGATQALTPEAQGSAADFREVLRLIGGGPASGNCAEAVAFSGRSEALMRGLLERYAFGRAPASYGELLGLCGYCDSLDAASGLGMQVQDQLHQWQQASFEVWRRKAPQLMPAIELFCAGDLAGLRALHEQEDTLARLGQRYLEPGLEAR